MEYAKNIHQDFPVSVAQKLILSKQSVFYSPKINFQLCIFLKYWRNVFFSKALCHHSSPAPPKQPSTDSYTYLLLLNARDENIKAKQTSQILITRSMIYVIAVVYSDSVDIRCALHDDKRFQKPIISKLRAFRQIQTYPYQASDLCK